MLILPIPVEAWWTEMPVNAVWPYRLLLHRQGNQRGSLYREVEDVEREGEDVRRFGIRPA